MQLFVSRFTDGRAARAPDTETCAANTRGRRCLAGACAYFDDMQSMQRYRRHVTHRRLAGCSAFLFGAALVCFAVLLGDSTIWMTEYEDGDSGIAWVGKVTTSELYFLKGEYVLSVDWDNADSVSFRHTEAEESLASLASSMTTALPIAVTGMVATVVLCVTCLGAAYLTRPHQEATPVLPECSRNVGVAFACVPLVFLPISVAMIITSCNSNLDSFFMAVATDKAVFYHTTSGADGPVWAGFGIFFSLLAFVAVIAYRHVATKVDINAAMEAAGVLLDEQRARAIAEGRLPPPPSSYPKTKTAAVVAEPLTGGKTYGTSHAPAVVPDSDDEPPPSAYAALV